MQDYLKQQIIVHNDLIKLNMCMFQNFICSIQMCSFFGKEDNVEKFNSTVTIHKILLQVMRC